MTLLERITSVLERARIAGGWDDEAVARRVLVEIREPSSVMKTAGFYTPGIHWGPDATIEDAGDCYRTMIDGVVGDDALQIAASYADAARDEQAPAFPQPAALDPDNAAIARHWDPYRKPEPE